MAECTHLRQGDVVIRHIGTESRCASVLVGADGVLPEDHWKFSSFAEALTRARYLTFVTGRGIWQVGPAEDEWTRIA